MGSETLGEAHFAERIFSHELGMQRILRLGSLGADTPREVIFHLESSEGPPCGIAAQVGAGRMTYQEAPPEAGARLT